MGPSVPPDATAAGSAPDLATLLLRKDYLALQAELAATANHAARDSTLYLGVLANRQNKPERALRLLLPVLTPAAATLAPALLLAGLNTLADCYVKLFRYTDAADTLTQILRVLGNSLSDEDTKDTEESLQLMNLLRSAPAQFVSLGAPFAIQTRQNAIGLTEIPVRIAGQNRSWILDTGANFSVVTRSAARELGLEVSTASASVSRAAGSKVWVQTSVVSELAIGQADFRNVVVLVVDDDAFYSRQAGFHIREILGFPVLSALQQLAIKPDGVLAVRSDSANLFASTALWLEGQTPLIALRVHDRQELFVLDTGARRSHLSARYFQRDGAAFAGKRPGQIHFGGIGEKSTVPAYVVPEISFKLGRAEVVLENVPVATVDMHTVADWFCGLIGQDFLLRFQALTLDFAAMTVSVGPLTAKSQE